MSRNARRENLTGYAFLIPWLIGIFVFTAFPFIWSMFLAFTDYNFIKEAKFVGLDNWKRMFSIKESGFDLRAFLRSDLFLSLKATFTYTVWHVPIHLILAFAAAMALNRKIKGIGVYRTIFYLPSFIGGSIGVAVMWKLFFSDQGFVNAIIRQLGFESVKFFSSTQNAIYTLIGISMYTLGGQMLIFLAGLQEVPQELYESATIDGAGNVAKFRKITLPLMSPIVLYNFIMAIIGSLQVFGSAFVITQGGPAKSTYFFALYLYEEAFVYFRLGYASALAWFIFFIIMIFTAIVLKVSGGMVFYESGMAQSKRSAREEIKAKRKLQRGGVRV